MERITWDVGGLAIAVELTPGPRLSPAAAGTAGLPPLWVGTVLIERWGVTLVDRHRERLLARLERQVCDWLAAQPGAPRPSDANLHHLAHGRSNHHLAVPLPTAIPAAPNPPARPCRNLPAEQAPLPCVPTSGLALMVFDLRQALSSIFLLTELALMTPEAVTPTDREVLHGQIAQARALLARLEALPD